ncbi:SEFIR domain-containing protein [Desulfitobacterium dehalogenans ATCC 51507]|uniref:SEFIR domain-containing protein n=1 Tax=Desulfitobacterium dehalogenans (strain ATCC 51507 / DSM 9161 / JW/IU-DC1) TaxID=756499 RepID=I4A778_DESDJ|nr:toll/interleukin-1 receptor domain-containing protein [Desulfitobacterium dehalogenans]AFL99812.1 SEFIR domain-containing protein [Desulfitobacterium dehalogenans ATCC 51507]
MPKKKIYFSYSWEEKENKKWIIRLKNDLSNEGLEIIFDQDELDKGTINIDRFISDNMNDADFIIIVITPSYINKSNIKNDGNGNRKRSWVEIENDYIIKRKHNNSKSLIPIIMKKKESNLPDNISGLTYYDMSNENLYKEELQKIRNIIHSEKVKTDIPLITREHPISNLIENIDILFNYQDNPPQVSAVVQYGEASLYLEQNQVLSLFIMVSKNNTCKTEDTSDTKVLSTEYFALPIRQNQYTEVLIKIEQGVNEYLKRVINYEALFEVDKFELLDESYSYKLLSVQRSYWNMLISVANQFDWDNGKTEWNIFQRNNYYIHVFSPIISYNKRYNSGEHAIYRVKKNEDINNDIVDIYVSVRDIIGFSQIEISERKSWGIRKAYNWLKEEFIPFVCLKKNLIVNDVIYRDFCKSEEDVFSQMQYFYMCSKAYVNYDEIIILRNALCFCLRKQYPKEDFNYIISKLGLSGINLQREPFEISESVIENLYNDKFISKIEKNHNNCSLADDILRCIKVFTDDLSRYKLNDFEMSYIIRISNSLIEKMHKVEMLEKYKDKKY